MEPSLIQLIILTCQLNSGAPDVTLVDQHQMLCHSYYAECVPGATIEKCMIERPKKFHYLKTYAPHNEHIKVDMGK